MKKFILVSLACLLPGSGFSEPSLSIYDYDLGLVTETVPLNLKKGINEVSFRGATGLVETESVVLRNPNPAVKFRVQEQSYHAAPISQNQLLHLYEGKELDFIVRESGKPDRIVTGKIISSGYTPPRSATAARLFRDAQHQFPQGQLVVEIDGKLSLSMPGVPVIPTPEDDSVFRPTLDWKIHSDTAAEIDARLSYLTRGFAWQANYNLIVAEGGDSIDLSGWATIENNSGKTFTNSKIHLVAGSVDGQNRQHDPYRKNQHLPLLSVTRSRTAAAEPSSATEVHVCPLPGAITLPDRSTKQIELVRTENLKPNRYLIYDGALIESAGNRPRSAEDLRKAEDYGIKSNTKVWLIHEIENFPKGIHHLPLPAGKMRIYQSSSTGQLQLLAEDVLEYTPSGQPLRLYAGDAPNLSGERKRISVKSDRSRNVIEETFEIRIDNRQKEGAVEVMVIEHLYRGKKWKIQEHSNTFLKTGEQTIEFLIPVEARESHTVSYTVQYSQ